MESLRDAADPGTGRVERPGARPASSNAARFTARSMRGRNQPYHVLHFRRTPASTTLSSAGLAEMPAPGAQIRFLEPRPVNLVPVRVMIHGQLAVGLLDVVVGRVRGHADHSRSSRAWPCAVCRENPRSRFRSARRSTCGPRRARRSRSRPPPCRRCLLSITLDFLELGVDHVVVGRLAPAASRAASAPRPRPLRRPPRRLRGLRFGVDLLAELLAGGHQRLGLGLDRRPCPRP